MIPILLLTAVPARAADAEAELAERLGVESLEDAAAQAGLSGIGTVLGGGDPAGFLSRLAREALSAAASREILRDLSAVMLAVILCSAAKAVFELSGAAFDAVTLAGAAAIMLLLAGPHSALLRETEQTVLRLQDMANVLLPLLGSAALVSGQVTAAASKYAVSALFLNVLVNLCCGFVLPLIRLYIAASAAETAGGSAVIGGILGFLKWCVTMSLTCLMLAFTLYLSLTAMTANSADAAVVRSAKTAISTLLPVVGSIAGDAAASLMAASAVIRQAVGAFGLLMTAGILLTPFLRTGLRYLLLKGVAAVSSELMDSRLSKLLTRLADTMTMLLGCLGSCTLLLYFSVFALIGTVAI